MGYRFIRYDDGDLWDIGHSACEWTVASSAAAFGELDAYRAF